MRKREEHRLREKLEIPDDYELHTLRLDFICHKDSKRRLDEDLDGLCENLRVLAFAKGLGLCRVRVTEQRGYSYGYDRPHALSDLDPSAMPAGDDDLGDWEVIQ